MLSVSNISKSFKYRSVLKDVSFTLNEGETVVIMGKNGAGKTTLLRIIARIMACEKGKIFFQNQNLLNGKPSIRKKILYIGHAPAMYSALSAIENLTLALDLRYIKANASKILDRLNHFGLGVQANDPISIYSQGMLQRLKLAYAELTDWDLLLFDEPFTGLDQDGAALMDKALTQWIKEGKTLCMVLHNMERAKIYGDQILYLNHGVMESL